MTIMILQVRIAINKYLLFNNSNYMYVTVSEI